MSTLFAVAIIVSNMSYTQHRVAVVIPLQKMEDCQIIQDQMRKAYGQKLINFDCFGNTK